MSGVNVVNFVSSAVAPTSLSSACSLPAVSCCKPLLMISTLPNAGYLIKLHRSHLVILGTPAAVGLLRP